MIVTSGIEWRLGLARKTNVPQCYRGTFRKDHSVSGGFADTSLAIHEQISNRSCPVLEKFGFITIKGLKISSVKVEITCKQNPQIIPIPAYLLLIYRSDLMKDINFNPASAEYGKLFDEYDDARRMSKGINFENRKSEVSKLSTAVLLQCIIIIMISYLPSVKFEELV